ncbi:MAG: ATP-dependent DNA helicase RecG [Aquificota bacterium]|nr:ATP-dependent DNA helicase RecG [Aquificota bacterium]
MIEREKLESFIGSLLEDGGVKLKRSIGVGMFLYNKLRDHAPRYLAENLLLFDRLPFEKRKAILEEVRRFLRDYRPPEAKRAESKPISRFLIPIDRIGFLTEQEKKLLKTLNLRTLLDILFYFPLRYEDRRPASLQMVRPGQKAVLKVRVEEVRSLNDRGYTAEVLCSDGSHRIKLLFRYKKTDFLRAVFRKGKEVVVYGRVKEFQGERYMVHPQLLKENEFGEIMPVYYIRVKGDAVRIPSRARHNRIREAVRKVVRRASSFLPEYLPDSILKKYSFPALREAVEKVHLPSGVDVRDLNRFSDPFHRRLIYEDLLVFQIALALKKLQTKGEKAPSLRVDPRSFVDEFERKIEFRLTNAQRRVLTEILEDMRKTAPMSRLLQGDVGSGKTVVAVGVALATVRSGYQVAVMVPTEILAHQHYSKFREVLEREGVKVGLLTGSMTPAQKRSVYRHIREGNLQVVVGTHALIQDKVEFSRLGLVIIDEQHRFGVMQRKVLLEKGKGFYPHCLVMSATPIPRTLALSVYGDLDLSVIDELPPGRKKVKTVIVSDREREKIVKAIKEEVSKGNKVYIIYPVIEESVSTDLKAATEEYERWAKTLEGMRVLLLHGRMGDREKREVMERFREEGDVLVSTTVIEVGIDVPEATLMIVEDAHRFGLSQLHQLRGRVGRSDRTSYCYLVVPESVMRPGSEALRRLKVLVRTQDGFEVAEEDLKIRGPGELLGVSQSGYFGFNIANLARSYDRSMLIKAREDAKAILEEDPRLERNRDLRDLIVYRYGDRLDLSFIA